VFDSLKRAFEHNQVEVKLKGKHRHSRRKQGQRIWGVESSFGLRCDSGVQTDLTCLADHQVQELSYECVQSLPKGQKSTLTGLRRHWAFTGPDDEASRDACRNVRQPAHHFFKTEVKAVQTEEPLFQLENVLCKTKHAKSPSSSITVLFPNVLNPGGSKKQHQKGTNQSSTLIEKPDNWYD